MLLVSSTVNAKKFIHKSNWHLIVIGNHSFIVLADVQIYETLKHFSMKHNIKRELLAQKCSPEDRLLFV
jgi:hypothetical protein